MNSSKRRYTKSRIRELSVEGVESGYYLLLLRLTAATTIRVGALGRFSLPAGWYVYAGSALQNMCPRLNRHFKRRKKARWHIDHLTTHRSVQVVGAVAFAAESIALDVTPHLLGECAAVSRSSIETKRKNSSNIQGREFVI